jgi:hypothetical protein
MLLWSFQRRERCWCVLSLLVGVVVVAFVVRLSTGLDYYELDSVEQEPNSKDSWVLWVGCCAVISACSRAGRTQTMTY